MLYACLGVCFCVSVGLTGLMLSIIDIDRYNFGLYLTLLSVVGTTIAIAFWIVKPEMCNSPQWFDRAATVLSIQMNATFRKRRRRRRKSGKSNKSASSMRTTTSFRRHSTKRGRMVAEVDDEVQKRSHSAQPPHASSSTLATNTVCRSSTAARIQITSQEGNNEAIASNNVHTESSPLLNYNLSKKRSSTWYSLYKKTTGDDSAFHDSPASSLSHAPCNCLFPMELHEQASQTEITASASQKLMLISGYDDEGMIGSPPLQPSIGHLHRSASDNPAIARSPLLSSYPPIDSDDSSCSDSDDEILSRPKSKAQPVVFKYSLSRLFVSRPSTDGAKPARSSSSDWLPSWRRGSPPVDYDNEKISYV